MAFFPPPCNLDLADAATIGGFAGNRYPCVGRAALGQLDP
jgi:hypothetical protein